MPSISKIRFTNVVYEDGLKRYNDEVFRFDGYNGALILENGGGKTVFIQTALQVVLPHYDLAGRKIKQTLQLDGAPAHIAIEWILSENPRRYLVTCVSLFIRNNRLDSHRYVYEYGADDRHSLENIPFVKENRPADRGEIADYYQHMASQEMHAQTFSTIKAFQAYLENQYHLITKEWESIAKINSSEGDVERFFEECKQTSQLMDRLLIPTVEEAIAGHDKGAFADGFEKHRDTFKLYKRLKESIEENRAIEQELQAYIATYEKLHQAKQAYESTKQKAKGLHQLIVTQMQEQERAQKDIRDQWIAWEQKEHRQRIKQASLVIQQQEEHRHAAQQAYDADIQLYDDVTDGLNKAKRTYYSLKLAEQKQIEQTQSQLIHQYENELAAFDEQEDIAHINERLDVNRAEWSGYYVQTLEASRKREDDHRYAWNPLNEQRERTENQHRDKGQQLDKVNQEANQLLGKIDHLQQNMKAIRGKLLANPEQESLARKKIEWLKRHHFLDEEIVRLQRDNKRLDEAMAEQQHVLEQLSQRMQENAIKKAERETKINHMDKAHREMKDKLTRLRPAWANLEVIYYEQARIHEQIQEKIAMLKKDMHALKEKERLAHRFADDYGGQDIFFADPFLARHVDEWLNQYTLIETGVRFIQSLAESSDQSVDSLLDEYPLWPVTLITAEKDKQALQAKVSHLNHHLQFPIVVLSMSEARHILAEGQHPFNGIIPEYWATNVDTDAFRHWQQDMEAEAKKASDALSENELILGEWVRTAEDLQQFLHDYPYDVYKHEKEQRLVLEQEVRQLADEKAQITRNIHEMTEKRRIQSAQIDDFKDEYQGLTHTLERANEYEGYAKQKDTLTERHAQLSEEIDTLQQDMAYLDQQWQALQEQCTELEEKIKQEQSFRLRLQDERMYQAVQGIPHVFTDKSKHVLEEEHRELELQLLQISRSRAEVETKLKSAQEQQYTARHQMEALRQEHSDLDEALTFPPFGREQLKDELQHMRDKEQRQTQLREKKEASYTLFIQERQSLEDQKKAFQETFPDEQLIRFSEPLSSVETQLHDAATHLQEQQAFLQNEQERIEKTLQAIEAARWELEKMEEGHHFKGPSVTATPLSTEEIQSFTYKRNTFVKNIITDLRNKQAAVRDESTRVESAKQYFRQFCHTKVSDVKMRERVISGIDRKNTYADIMEFQRNMQKAIDTAIRYNEETIMTHDRQLEQFITHMHNHLRTIAEELTMIPKKTKVKVDDDWKQIYKFTIPEWKEEDGKSRLREHIEWILSQLEKDVYVGDDGQADKGKVRKDIETWLHSKQLLRIVMNNEIMKVTCRKVTNDNHVTTRHYSWEQTNVWSGGEKWSKNMTLYLGILNYIAEKHKHVTSTMQRHRIVILDNPFGKASSDHVLNPVFFIAEQLGFQMIALTAHAEGKFLHDYFPVIYSCRLRSAADPTKQIMTKEKHLHHAYFQDHEPQALERLGETEQLSLFE